MKGKSSNLRFQHVGKTYQEKVAYQKFLREHRYLDKTEEKPTGLEPTYQSSFDDEKKDLPGGTVRPKSLKLKFLDFFRDNILIAILTVVVIGYVTLASTINSQNVKIDDIKEDVKALTEKNDLNNQHDNDLNTDLQVLKVNVEKDIEYLKTTINFSKK